MNKFERKRRLQRKMDGQQSEGVIHVVTSQFILYRCLRLLLYCLLQICVYSICESRRSLSLAGRYLYIETSSPRRLGDKAKLHSSLIRTSARGACFTFWYHMNGYAVGQLNIFVNSTVAGGRREQLIWRLSGDQGNVWRRAAVAVGAAASPASSASPASPASAAANAAADARTYRVSV